MNFKELIYKYIPSSEINNLVLLQVGANDGRQSDPFRESILEFKINSHLLEPIPDFYEMLVNNYLEYTYVKCYNIGITNLDGEQIIDYVPKIDGLPEWTQGLGTFDKSKNFIGFGMGGHNLKIDFSESELYKTVKNNIKSILVKTNTLSNFLNQNKIMNLDLYVSDTEGFDWVVFEQLDLDKYHPKIIHMETHSLGIEQNELIDLKLAKYGYEILDKTWDTIAIKNLI